jgi:peroxiredoxin family protein
MNKIIGLDVSKNWLDICVYNTSDKPKYHRFANDAVGHEEMIKLAKEQEIKLIICEPTGGYEAEICQKLYNNKQQIHKVNTYSFNSFSKSVNFCKTDKQDAFKWLCCMNQILKVLFNFCQKSGKCFGIRHAEFCHDIKNISSYFTFGFLV